MTRTFALACALTLLGGVRVAYSQEGQPDRFFSDKVDEAEDKDDDKDDGPDETLIQGSFTSSTFAYREVGSLSNNAPDGVEIDNASPVARLFTDLRAQVDAKHIRGGTWDARIDTRARVANACQLATQDVSRQANADELYSGLCRVQSGTFGGREIEARELYVRKNGAKTDFQLGRQFVTELAAVKIDGLRVTYRRSKSMSLLGFVGLYPARGSRSIFDDYPGQVQIDPITGQVSEVDRRLMPAAGGAGASYRYAQFYGSAGVVGILPLADEADSGLAEPLRAFITASGYWRQSNKLDVYHFAVVDFQGAAGRGLTNLSLGVNYRPAPMLRVSASVNQVDTETLNVIAQTQLEDRDPQGGLIQSNIDVARISSQSARLGVSAAFKERRFEVSASGQVRQRPDIELRTAANIDDATMVETVIQEARSAEVMLSVLDRRSFKGLRLGASVINIFGLGEQNLRRSNARVVRLSASRDYKGGRGVLDVDLSYLTSEDESRDDNCVGAPDVLSCFGTASTSTLALSGTTFYRLKEDWMVVGSASAGTQTLENTLGVETATQPANLLLSAFVRLAYRF